MVRSTRRSQSTDRESSRGLTQSHPVSLVDRDGAVIGLQPPVPPLLNHVHRADELVRDIERDHLRIRGFGWAVRIPMPIPALLDCVKPSLRHTAQLFEYDPCPVRVRFRVDLLIEPVAGLPLPDKITQDVEGNV